MTLGAASGQLSEERAEVPQGGPGPTVVTGTVSLSPLLPQVGDLLTATPAGFNGLPPLTYNYSWTLNGGGTGVVASTYSTAGLTVGDLVAVSVSITDALGHTSGAATASVTVVSTPGPGGTLSIVHSGNASRVQINTTGLWTTSSPTPGNAPPGSTVTVDGVAADAKYTQPTPGSPVTPAAGTAGCWLLPPGVHTFALQNAGTVYYTTTVDVVFRTYPWTSLVGGDVTGLSSTYWNGAWPKDPIGPFHDTYALNNGWSIVPDPVGSGCMFCVIPGDDASSAQGSSEFRSEFNIQDNWKPTDLPAAVLDLLGNLDRGTRFIRFDHQETATWTAPVVPQSANNAAWVSFWQTRRPGLLMWPNSTNANPTNGLHTATQVVTNSFLDIPALSNENENGGPAVFVWVRGQGSNQQQFVYQPVALGVDLPVRIINTVNVAFDNSARTSTIVETALDLYATGNGVPWLAPPGVVHGTPNATGTATAVDATSMTDGTASWTTNAFANKGVMVGNSVAIVASNTATKLTLNGAGWQGGTPSVSTYIVGNPWSTTKWVAPYGVPLGADNKTLNPPYGGGFTRVYQRYASITVRSVTYTNAWHCLTEGDAFAVAGIVPIYDDTGVVLNGSEGPFDPDAGKIFGPTFKTNGAHLLTGPDGSSGTAIKSTTAPPFTISLNNFGQGNATSMAGVGIVPECHITIDNERMTYNSINTGTSSVTINKRAQGGTTAADHVVGAQVVCEIEATVMSPGINALGAIVGQMPVPWMNRLWPLLIGRRFASVCGAPATSYP